ncbi:MAG: hypothetical protein MSH40_05680 [Christensenella sp.]|nr:hypothetical protein [Christensenella sp.]
MIYYATQQTLERYKLNTPENFQSETGDIVRMIANKERGNRLYEWGCKLFYFDRRKCLQVVHFASKLTIFLIDIKMDDIVYATNAVAQYIFDIYDGDKMMKRALERYFKSSPIVVFDKITDRSIIATLNKTQSDWAEDGYYFYEFIINGILQTKEINRKINRDWIFTRKVNGKTEYIRSAEEFEKLIKENFKA